MAEGEIGNRDLARALFELADLLELAGETEGAPHGSAGRGAKRSGAPRSTDRDSRGGSFRVRALRRGGQAIERLPEPAVELLRRRELQKLRNVGEGIARRVDELITTGRLAELEDARERYAGLVQVARLDGLGPTTTRMLHERLGVRDLDQLEEAAATGRLAGVPGFSPKRIEALLASIQRARTPRGLVRRDIAEREAAPFLAAIRAAPGVGRVELVGSLRRRRELVNDVDIVAAVDDYLPVSAAFCAVKQVEVVLARGTRSSVRTFSGLQVDVWLVPPGEFGMQVHAFSSGKEHNILLRNYALKKGIKITEHGIYEHAGAGARRPGGLDEAEIYAALGLPFIPPEMREGRGEVELAARNALPRLVTLADVRGDLHVHSTASDGKLTLEEIAAEAARLGREYVAVCDHSTRRGGLDADGLRAQTARIRALNEKLGGKPRLLSGIEVDILPDGWLDLPARALDEVDWVLGAIHGESDLPRAAQTQRVVRAIESGHIDALAHPTGRIPGVRDGLDLDVPEIIAAAARTDVALEINAHLDRLDPSDVVLFAARERGAWFSLGSDAHDAAGLDKLSWGIDLARRGWLEAEHLLNTRPVEDLLDLVRARRREAGISE